MHDVSKYNRFANQPAPLRTRRPFYAALHEPTILPMDSSYWKPLAGKPCWPYCRKAVSVPLSVLRLPPVGLVAHYLATTPIANSLLRGFEGLA